MLFRSNILWVVSAEDTELVDYRNGLLGYYWDVFCLSRLLWLLCVMRILIYLAVGLANGVMVVGLLRFRINMIVVVDLRTMNLLLGLQDLNSLFNITKLI